MIVDLTENELKVALAAVWLRLNHRQTLAVPPGPYREWLESAEHKLLAALPPVREFAENH